MTLEKALEILLEWKCDASYPTLPDQVDALNLATEAMKRITYLRRRLPAILCTHLPSETDVHII